MLCHAVAPRSRGWCSRVGLIIFQICQKPLTKSVFPLRCPYNQWSNTKITMVDIDDIFAPIITGTLYIWIIPYAIWYFVSGFIKSIWNWITEPENEKEKN